MVQLVGYFRSSGDFKGTDGKQVKYDKFVLSFISDEMKNHNGFYAYSAEASADNFEVLGAKSLDECVGKPVFVMMDMAQKADTQGKIKAKVSKIMLIR